MNSDTPRSSVRPMKLGDGGQFARDLKRELETVSKERDEISERFDGLALAYKSIESTPYDLAAAVSALNAEKALNANAALAYFNDIEDVRVELNWLRAALRSIWQAPTDTDGTLSMRMRLIAKEALNSTSAKIKEGEDAVAALNENEKYQIRLCERLNSVTADRDSILEKLDALSAIINAARDRGCAEHDPEIKWLIELPMTNEEAQRFNLLTNP